MRMTRFWVPALFVLTWISVGTAQNSIRLRFEVYRNGALVGNPEVSVTSGTTGSLAMDGIGTIAFTPTSRDSDSVSVAFDIDSCDKHAHPRVVVRGNDPGSASWSCTASKESFKVTVTWVR
jgi:hypothetical protein